MGVASFFRASGYDFGLSLAQGMNMLKNASLNYILLFAMLIVGVIAIFAITRIRREKQPLKRAGKGLMFSTIALGIFLVALWLALPDTSLLSTFGYPKTVEDIQSTSTTLKYLQDYNTALVRTISVLQWSLLIFITWFLTSLYLFTYSLVSSASESSDSVDTHSTTEQ